jgi:hypothetical protein
MTIHLEKKINKWIFFVSIIILPMLNYFQLLYDYFSLISIISPYIIYDYLWLFSNTFGYSKLLSAILIYFTLGYFQLL